MKHEDRIEVARFLDVEHASVEITDDEILERIIAVAFCANRRIAAPYQVSSAGKHDYLFVSVRPVYRRPLLKVQHGTIRYLNDVRRRGELHGAVNVVDGKHPHRATQNLHSAEHLAPDIVCTAKRGIAIEDGNVACGIRIALRARQAVRPVVRVVCVRGVVGRPRRIMASNPYPFVGEHRRRQHG